MREPPFCPNPLCPYHKKQLHVDCWFQRFGAHMTKSAGIIPRFRCKYCLKTFSTRTFSIDYYTKRLLSYEVLLQNLASGMSTRALSRWFSATTETIQNRIDRLARNLIAFQEQVLRRLLLKEDLVSDGFATFTHSQYFPDEISILVGKRSQFLYYINQVTVRRSGRMSEKQKRIREQLYEQVEFEPKGVEHRFSELLSRVVSLMSLGEGIPALRLYTDEKLEYARAVANDPVARHLRDCGYLTHLRISSTAPRTTNNPLFSVNYMDREFRKDLANHHRETLCFSRNVCASMNRLMLYSFYHNYCKAYRIDNAPEQQPLHAEVAGVENEVLEQRRRVFRERAFLSLERIEDSLLKLWKKELRTPLKKKSEYLPAFALG